VFVMLGEPTGPPEFFNQGGPLETRLFRLQGDGQSAADWPTGGTLVSNAPYEYFDGGPEAGYRVLPDGLDGVQVGVPGYGEYGSSYSFSVLQADGNGKPSSSVGGALPGYDMIPNARGGVFLADFNGSGPYGPYQPWAYLRVTQSLPGANWSDFFEIHFDIVVQWYGDIALAPAGDAGAVFFWSQVRDRTGLFARRFNSAGEVTGVPPGAPSPPAVLALSRLRFVAGSGVMARVALPDDRGARLDLFDVSGRRVASSRLEGLGAGSRDVAVPESSRLASGLYFARLAAAGETRAGRVMVAR
jgi:hypothetical protein